MDLHDIKAFIDAMAASDLGEMEITRDGWTLRLSRSARQSQTRLAPSESAAKPESVAARTRKRIAKAPSSGTLEPTSVSDGMIRAPLFGVVHFHPAPGEPAFVSAGQSIAANATVCVIEAMKTFNAVRSSHAGIVETILVASGTEVEAGQPLMRIV